MIKNYSTPHASYSVVPVTAQLELSQSHGMNEGQLRDYLIQQAASILAERLVDMDEIWTVDSDYCAITGKHIFTQKIQVLVRK